MQKNIFLVLLICLPLLAMAQSNPCLLKVYAYSRSVIGGAAPTVIIEMNGTSSTEPSKNNNQYSIYFKTCYVNQVTIQGAWINGDSYSARAHKTNTPVMVDNASGSPKAIKEVLVPKTTGSVWEIVLSRDETMLKPTPAIQKMIKANSLVITGILKGKKFTTSLKNIKVLEAIAAQ